MASTTAWTYEKTLLMLSLTSSSSSSFQALDQDQKKSITYTIVRGDTGRFRMEAQTGRLTTTQGLDFERQQKYVLVISTREASGAPGTNSGYSATVSVAVLVSVCGYVEVSVGTGRQLRLDHHQVLSSAGGCVWVCRDEWSAGFELRLQCHHV